MFRLARPDCVSSRSTPLLLAIAFAAFYLAIGPGRFFSVDEVLVESMARAVYSRNNLEVPAMNTVAPGRAGANYVGHRGPALGYVSMLFVAVGDLLDNRFGSLNGGIAAGPATGTLEHPLRWGGRLSIFVVLGLNAIFGGLVVSMLYLISLRMSGSHHVALCVATAVGTATLLASESTHFFQHVLESLMLLTGFWFLISSEDTAHRQRAWLGGLALGLAVLARPNAAPAATVIWCYGAVTARRQLRENDGRQFLEFLPRAIVLPVVCVVAYLLYNHWQFGNAFQIGNGERAFELSLEAPKAAAAYLMSPGLSVFLYAPPLALILFCLGTARARWPLETQCILVSAGTYALVILFFRWWDGSISYGPRYMLAPILLLMPLTIHAFERALKRLVRWRVAALTTIVFGFLVQLIGISVYVVVNEWYQNQHNLRANGAFVFVPQASPIWVHLQEILAGRNMTMWALRAVSAKSTMLVLFLVGLMSTSVGAYWLALKSVRPARSQLPAAITMSVGVLVLFGFLSTEPITMSDVRVAHFIIEGLTAQQAGLPIKVEELYALVLGLDPANKYAMHNLAILYEGVGKTAEAISLYQKTLVSDPQFVPALQNLARYRDAHGEMSTVVCVTATDCHAVGQRLLDSGDVPGALRVWDEASRRFPAEGWMIRNVAWCRYQLGDYEGAIRDYTRAADRLPEDDGIRTDLAWSLLRAARFDEARETGNELLRRDPENAAAKAILAQIPTR